MVIKIELGQRVTGALPTIDNQAISLIENKYWTWGYWRYVEGKIIFEVEEGDYPFEAITAWVELPKNLEELSDE